MMELIVNYLPLFGVLALAFVFLKNTWVSKQDEGSEKMAQIEVDNLRLIPSCNKF